MKVLLVTTGSRGDVEPFTALARGLDHAGHAATLAAPARFGPLARAHGVAFIGLDDTLLDMRDELAGRGPAAAVTGAARARSAFERFLVDVASLADHATDAVVYHPKTLAAPMIAECQGVPAIAAQLIPLYRPTGEFPAPVLTARVPPWLNRATWALVPMIEAPWRGMLRRLRRDRFGLATPLTGLAERVREGGSLNAWSPHLLPAPAEWAAAAAPLGFWRLPAGDGHPPRPLRDFLDAGESPIYVGFGSMTGGNPAELGDAVVKALRRAGRRGVVATGSGALELPGTDDIFVVDQVPHAWLFPRVAAAVHHGGVGTLAAALTAGIPQVIKPFLGDQHFWARRAHAIGVGVPLRAVTPGALAGAIDAAVTVRAPRARALGALAARDDGVRAAITRITRHVERSATR